MGNCTVQHVTISRSAFLADLEHVDKDRFPGPGRILALRLLPSETFSPFPYMVAVVVTSDTSYRLAVQFVKQCMTDTGHLVSMRIHEEFS